MPNYLDSCPYCNSRDIYTVWPETNWDKCRSCSLFFRNPMPTKEELDILYNQSWTNPEDSTSETGGTDEYLAGVYANKLAKSLKLNNFKGLRILDYGAGRGAMLNALRNLGADVCGVDPYGVEYLKNLGFEAYRDLSELNNSYNGIVMIDVFEHLPKPWLTIKDLYNLLLKDGWIYICTGNPLGLNARISGGNWREAKKPGHLFWPTPRLMVQLLKDIGFKKVYRLKWLVRYSNNPFKRTIHFFTQLIGLDGALRYLAYK